MSDARPPGTELTRLPLHCFNVSLICDTLEQSSIPSSLRCSAWGSSQSHRFYRIASAVSSCVYFQQSDKRINFKSLRITVME